MKKTIGLILVLLCGLAVWFFALRHEISTASGSAAVNGPAALEDPSISVPFTGEKISYSIKKFGVQAGQATLVFEGLTKMGEEDVYLAVLTVTAFNFFDEEKIYLNPRTFYPVMVKRNLNLWGKEEEITEDYSVQANSVKITKTVGEKTTEQTLSQPKPLDNIYSFIYRYRLNGTFQIGEKLTLQLPTKSVHVYIEEKTTLKANGEDFSAYFMNSEDGQYRIWFDASPKKIPLRIDGAGKVGSTSMVMTGYEKGHEVGLVTDVDSGTGVGVDAGKRF